MNALQRLALAILPKQQKAADNTARFSSLSMPGMPVYSDMSVRKSTREGYRMSIYVYRAIRTIVQAGSGIPWIVLDNKGEVIENHPFVQLMKRPNPQFTGQDMMEYLISHLKLVGNALWQPTIIGGQPRELWVVMPDLVQPIPSAVSGQWLSGYQVALPGGGQRIVPPESFIHFMEFDPGNPFWGIGPLMAAARTVDTDNEAQDTQKLSMQNRGMPSGIISPESDMTEEQFKEAARVMKERYLQKSKRREPWIMSRAVKWQETMMTPVEMDYIASRIRNLRDIAGAFGISPIFLGDLEQSSYNNMAEARKALYQDCVIPLLDDVKATLNLKLAPYYGDIEITYDLSNVAALREETAKKVDQAQKLWAMGIPFEQINAKLELGFNEFPGWDEGYLPLTLMPTGASGNAAPVKMLTKALNLDTEEKKSAFWKRQDRRRVAWWGVVQRKVTPLYVAEKEAVLKAFDGGSVKVAIEAQRGEWEKTLVAVSSALVEDFGKQTAEDLSGKGTGPSERKYDFELTRAVRAWLSKHAAENVKSILETQLAEVRVVIAAGHAEGLTMTQIGSKLRSFYEDRNAYKAMRVARTEVAQAAGFAQHEAAKQSGVAETKTWISSRDERVRDSHSAVDGETVKLDEKYSNRLMFPGDPAGDPGETVNCRCVEGYGV